MFFRRDATERLVDKVTYNRSIISDRKSPTHYRPCIARHPKIGNTVRLDRVRRNRKINNEGIEGAKGNLFQTGNRIRYILERLSRMGFP